MLDAADSGPLQGHFDDMEQQADSSVLGMWVFVAQEIMFFGGLFTLYMIYRLQYPTAFKAGSQLLDVRLGAFNTAVLILSSFTMAMAVWGAQTGKKKVLVWMLIATLLLGGVFLGVKYVEYSAKFEHHLVPGSDFQLDSPVANNVQLFMVLYFAMTGMHALHMVIGSGLLLWIIVKAMKGRYTPKYSHPIEIFGLYWHFVDIVWIFLFPMLYLLGRH